MVKLINSLVLLFIIILSLNAFENSSIILNKKTFQENVLKSKNLWLILFYNPEKEDSQNLNLEFEKAAFSLKGIFKFGSINIKTEKELALKYDIISSPKMKFFGINKEEFPLDFTSIPKASSIIEKMILKAQSLAKKNINITDDEATLYSIEHNPQITVLNDDNFEETIHKNELMWMVAIHSPKCGICKKLLPQWAKAAERLKGKAKFAIVDGLINRKISRRFSLKGYPLIKIFSPGFGKMKKIEDYDGPRDENGIVEYVLKKYEAYMYINEPPQITSQDILNNECINKEGYCIINLLPNIISSSKIERLNFINSIKIVAKNYKFSTFHFLWAQEGDFYKFEKNLKINKYPMTIAVDFQNKKFSYKNYDKIFDEFSLERYIKNLLEKKETLLDYNGGLEITKVNEWDRNDYISEDL